MFKLKVLLYISLCFVLQFTQAQSYSFIQYSTAEGLPQSQITSIAQDQQGYLWVGTFGGLAKFNGLKFENFTKDNGILSNRISFIKIINNNVYIGHENGISVQINKDSLKSIKHKGEATSAPITQILEYNNEIYISSNGNGLYTLKNNQLLAIEDAPLRIRNMTLMNGNLYLATREGIYAYDNHTFRYFDKFPEDSYSSIQTHQDGKSLLASTFNGALWQYSNNKTTLIFEDKGFRIREIFQDDKGNVWIFSKNGLIKLDKENNSNVKINDLKGLPINDVTAVFQDFEENIWIGTGGKGLLKFTGEKFKHYNTKNGLPSDLIISTISENSNNLWISTFDKGVFLLEKGKAQETKHIKEIESTVWSIAKKDDTYYFGSVFGLYLLKNDKWHRYFTKDGLPSNKITGLKVLNETQTIISSSEGLAIINKNGDIEKIFKNNPHLKNIRSFEYQNKRVFAGAGNKLFELTASNYKLLQVFDGAINSIKTDKHERIWVGSENGLYYIKDSTAINFKLNINNISDFVNFIVSDEKSIFIGTNNGLYEIDPNDLANVNYYGINSGLVDLETNLNSAYIDQQGDLWFGTASGLMHMNRSRSYRVPSSIKPKLHLMEINVNFEEKGHELPKKALSLKYSENNIIFNFDAIYLTNPSGIHYTYYLEGYSDTWSPPSTNNSINFTNLPPASYQLMVKAITDDGKISEKLIIPFEISPPFYMTWWFYALTFISIILILFAIDQQRAKVLRQKNYQHNLEIKNKLNEYEQQSLNANMNRHFIFNSLNSIQYYINASDKKSANKFLTQFAKLIRKNLDSSNNSNGMVSLEDEIDRLKLYLELEKMRFNDKFSYNIGIDENVESELLQVPTMFLQPFVENSLIHGILPLKNKEGIIDISITDHFDHIKIVIFDNGIGYQNSIDNKIKTADSHDSQGMMITKNRIKLLQQVSAKSIEMIGPTQINENDSTIKGTKVVFKILKQYLV